MKKRYIIIEFLVVFVFLALPPLFATASSGILTDCSFSPFSFIQLAIAFTLLFQLNRFFPEQDERNRTSRFFSFAYWWIITFGILMLVFAACQALEIFFKYEIEGNQIEKTAPENILEWTALIFTTAAGAFYEEVLYRRFLPSCIFKILEPTKKIVIIALEFSCIAVFAFSHRYMGWSSVLNSFLGGIILRNCYLKTKSIAAGTLAHFIYNTTLLVFYSLSN